MNRKILIIAFIMCFSAVNVFSFPNKEVSGNEDLKKEIDSLKKSQEETNKALKELSGKIGSSGGTQPNPPRPDEVRNSDNKLVPLTWETARLFEDDLYKLDFFINKNLNLPPKEQNKNYGIVKDGKILENTEKNLPDENLIINNNTPVKATKFSLNPKNKATIDIYYSGQSAVLKFKRNTRDYFELESVTKNTRDYPFNEEVLLYVHDERSQSKQNSVQSSSTQTSSTSSVKRPPIPEDIMLKSGQSNYLKSPAVVKYLTENSKGVVSTRDIKAIVDHYINEARKEKINHDIAIAQMCYATKNLTKKVLFNNMNYADLSTAGTNWNGKFPRSIIGVRAHIQHLKGYASTKYPEEEAIVDPRFRLLENIRGKCGTLHELSKYWVKEDKEKYEKEINDILVKLYDYQENYK
jgi:hypothetical protein